jgi:hypothetical protein
LAVIQKFLAKLLCSCVCLTLGGIAAVDHKLHKFDEVGIGTVHDGDATRSDLTINGGEAAGKDVIEHKNGILTYPFPGRVEVTGFKCVENGLNTFDISVAVLTPDAVQSSLNLQ